MSTSYANKHLSEMLVFAYSIETGRTIFSFKGKKLGKPFIFC
ncbi:hypothetical protein D922_03419 [Enterococcus faecalis 06-MB-DW-09]|nr:hypothetical protein D922_03419 [Enterococcus faecalis 06-MB-DW-09]